ncbi:MAG: hypothetical protein KIT31_11820 [Deltaproteobacteria bacterium]|nr:hypothetical protein [Deltaproteobacteria bacterium]
MRALSACFASALFFGGLACGSAGGSYVQNERAGLADRGDTNGRMLDFVVNQVEGSDWQIRVRGNSLWAAFTDEEQKLTDLGTIRIAEKDSDKLWKLIDSVDIPSRKKGKKDEDEGWVELRLREPGGDEGHEVTTIFISRATKDEDVIDLAEYLRELIKKYHQKKPDF